MEGSIVDGLKYAGAGLACISRPNGHDVRWHRTRRSHGHLLVLGCSASDVRTLSE